MTVSLSPIPPREDLTRADDEQHFIKTIFNATITDYLNKEVIVRLSAAQTKIPITTCQDFL